VQVREHGTGALHGGGGGSISSNVSNSESESASMALFAERTRQMRTQMQMQAGGPPFSIGAAAGNASPGSEGGSPRSPVFAGLPRVRSPRMMPRPMPKPMP